MGHRPSAFCAILKTPRPTVRSLSQCAICTPATVKTESASRSARQRRNGDKLCILLLRWTASEKVRQLGTYSHYTDAERGSVPHLRSTRKCPKMNALSPAAVLAFFASCYTLW